MEELSTLYWVVVVASGLILLCSLTNPWRAFMGWVGALSIQMSVSSIDFLRPAISDAFLVPMTALVVLGMGPGLRRCSRKSRPPTGNLGAAIVAFGFLFLTLGTTMEYYNIGMFTSWTLVNKDIGLICLVVAYFIGVRLIDSELRLYRIVEVFVVSGFVLNTLAVIGGVLMYAFGIGNDMLREGTTLRLCGLMINPGSYGGWLLCLFSLQLALLLDTSGRIVRMSRKLQWSNVVLAAVGIIMTISRSAYIGFLVALLAIALFEWR